MGRLLSYRAISPAEAQHRRRSRTALLVLARLSMLGALLACFFPMIAWPGWCLEPLRGVLPRSLQIWFVLLWSVAWFFSFTIVTKINQTAVHWGRLAIAWVVIWAPLARCVPISLPVWVYACGREVDPRSKTGS